MKLFTALLACFVAQVAATANNTTTSTSASGTGTSGAKELTAVLTSVVTATSNETAAAFVTILETVCNTANSAANNKLVDAGKINNIAATSMTTVGSSSRRLEEVENRRRLAQVTATLKTTYVFAAGLVTPAQAATARTLLNANNGATFGALLTTALNQDSNVQAAGTVTGVVPSVAVATTPSTTASTTRGTDVSAAVITSVAFLAFVLNIAQFK